MTWAAVKEFDEVLDVVRTDGPQVVTRGEQEFIVLTREEWEARKPAGQRAEKSVELSIWDALRVELDPDGPQPDFSRDKDDHGRMVSFE